MVDQNHHCFINILQKIVTFRKIDKNLVADTFFLETKIVVFHENVIFFLVRSRSGIFLEFFVLLNTSGGPDDVKGSPKRIISNLGAPMSKSLTDGKVHFIYCTKMKLLISFHTGLDDQKQWRGGSECFPISFTY